MNPDGSDLKRLPDKGRDRMFGGGGKDRIDARSGRGGENEPQRLSVRGESSPGTGDLWNSAQPFGEGKPSRA